MGDLDTASKLPMMRILPSIYGTGGFVYPIVLIPFPVRTDFAETLIEYVAADLRASACNEINLTLYHT